MNAIKRSVIAENLVRNPNFTKLYKDSKFKIFRQFSNVSNLFKLQVKLFLLSLFCRSETKLPLDFYRFLNSK